jgi:integrase
MSARILKVINKALGGTDELKVIGNMTMYSFRHTYATNLYYNAVKPGIISTKKAAQIMGHSEEMFIKRYTHLDDDKEQMDALRDALSGKRDAEGMQGDTRETAKTG